MNYKVIKKDRAGNKIVQMPDGTMAVYNKNGMMVNMEGSKRMMKKSGFKTKSKGRKLYASPVERSEKFLERNLIGAGFRKPRKGLINLNSLDDLTKM